MEHKCKHFGAVEFKNRLLDCAAVMANRSETFSTITKFPEGIHLW